MITDQVYHISKLAPDPVFFRFRFSSSRCQQPYSVLDRPAVMDLDNISIAFA